MCGVCGEGSESVCRRLMEMRDWGGGRVQSKAHQVYMGGERGGGKQRLPGWRIKSESTGPNQDDGEEGEGIVEKAHLLQVGGRGMIPECVGDREVCSLVSDP